MSDIQVISRNAIPPIEQVEQDGEIHKLGELRDFRWNEQLREFMKSTSFSASWVQLGPGETLAPHVHPVHSMMVFYAGSGQVLGDLERAVVKEDVVVVPAGCAHGFVGGPSGLYALSLQFSEGLYTTPEKPRVVFLGGEDTLSSVLLHNEEKARAFAAVPLFELLSDGTLTTPRRRRVLLDALKLWDAKVSELFMSSHVSCGDADYKEAFARNVIEALDHEGTVDEASDLADAVFDATSSWFAYQVHMLDNVEKLTLVSLVVKRAQFVLHQSLRAALASLRVEHELPASLGAEANLTVTDEALLRNHSPETYARLRNLVDEGWDMVHAVATRMVELTLSAANEPQTYERHARVGT